MSFRLNQADHCATTPPQSMNTPGHTRIRKFAALAGLTALGFWGGTSAHANNCPLDQSVFHDSGGQGFVLAFTQAHSPHAQVTAQARITHPTRGTLFNFEMGRTNGYGATYLTQTPLPGQEEADRQRHHGVYFFDKHLKPLMGQPTPPAWLFIENLGPADHYDARHRTPPGPELGDPMWAFAHCKKPKTGAAGLKQ